MVISLANDCDFHIKIEGDQQSIRTFLSLMHVSDTERTNGTVTQVGESFFQTYDAWIYRSDETPLWIEGYCAWSVQTCLIDEHPDNYINLVIISQDLNLRITIKSREIGLCFSEHYIIENGEIIVDQCEAYDYFSFYDEEGEFLDEEREIAFESLLNID